jgi:hypothetical protein
MVDGEKIAKLAKVSIGALLVGLLPIFAVYSTLSSHQVPAISEIQKNNYSQYYNISHKRAIKKSRESVVQVLSFGPDNAGYFSSASGTYFKAYGNYFVITVMHGILGPCAFTTIVHNNQTYPCLKYVATDLQNDYAIIQVSEIPDRSPVDIFRDLPKNTQWKDSYSVLNKLIYTGYPNTIGPLTIEGEVAGFSGREYIYMLSYAWAGSSGSGVFDHRGRYIGYVVAIDVGESEFGVQVLQNVVLVSPAFKVDWTKAITDAE